MTITCVGDCGVDYYIDKKLLRPGGITLNFAVHARRVFPKKNRVQVVSAVGNDKEARIVKETIKKYHLVPFITTLPGKTPVQYINHHKKGEKIFTKYEEGVLDSFTLGKREKEIVEKSDVVMTVIYEQIEKLFESIIYLKPKKIMAVDFMDLADYGKKTNVVKKYIDSFNLAFFGLKHQEKNLLKQLKALTQRYKKLFVITLGATGSMAYEGNKEYFAKPVRVKKIIDTTGAGDAFAAFFLKNYLYTKDIEKSLIEGNKAAAKIVQQLGTF